MNSLFTTLLLIQGYLFNCATIGNGHIWICSLYPTQNKAQLFVQPFNILFPSDKVLLHYFPPQLRNTITKVMTDGEKAALWL